MSAILSGPKGSRRISLIFDTGAVVTQVHTATLNRIGYGQAHHIQEAVMVGAGGERHRGTLLKSEKIFTLGKKIEGLPVGAFDFSDLADAGIDGLLGWDIIKQFHLEMDGPAGVLKVF